MIDKDFVNRWLNFWNLCKDSLDSNKCTKRNLINSKVHGTKTESKSILKIYVVLMEHTMIEYIIPLIKGFIWIRKWAHWAKTY